MTLKRNLGENMRKIQTSERIVMLLFHSVMLGTSLMISSISWVIGELLIAKFAIVSSTHRKYFMQQAQVFRDSAHTRDVPPLTVESLSRWRHKAVSLASDPPDGSTDPPSQSPSRDVRSRLQAQRKRQRTVPLQ